MYRRSKKPPFDPGQQIGRTQRDSWNETFADLFPYLVEFHEVIGNDVEGAGHVRLDRLDKSSGHILFMDKLPAGIVAEEFHGILPVTLDHCLVARTDNIDGAQESYDGGRTPQDLGENPFSFRLGVPVIIRRI